MSLLRQFDITPEREASSSQYYYRQFFASTPLIDPIVTNLKGKTALVTGGNTGLGREVARQLLDLGLGKLIIAARDIAKGQLAAESLSVDRLRGSFSIEVWSLDLSSYDSVLALQERAKTLDRLDIVVLNAGIYKVNESFHPTTSFDEDIQVNYLSNALLASLLLPILNSSATTEQPSRLVLVSSDTAAWVSFQERTCRPLLPSFQKQQSLEKKWDMHERYGTSKVLGQLFITHLSERVPPSRVIITTANPGFCYGSELAREGKGTILGFAFGVWTRMLGKPLAVGARSLVHAAVSFGEEAHGQYVEDGKLRPMAPMVYTVEGREVAEVLWKETLAELEFARVQEAIEKFAVQNT